ncbi:DUF1493 family protein [Flavobacterium sp. '19STA2R22 D10 B1']|uniref:DUF1493 family protein n=1 Tax=Flavobacterium aerium TaxID=3037261 RepID=UPI00278C40DE|nr:DUF1493 family protein [Flavobacterium sp. '19STA2R22 D10 B1']
MNELEKDVLLFFRKALNKEIRVSSNLSDFCKYEDDAFYLFLEFFEKFKIKKGYLDLDKYFYKTPKFWDIIRFKKIKQKQKQPITIGHMIEVVKKGEWFDPLE